VVEMLGIEREGRGKGAPHNWLSLKEYVHICDGFSQKGFPQRVNGNVEHSSSTFTGVLFHGWTR